MCTMHSQGIKNYAWNALFAYLIAFTYMCINVKKEGWDCALKWLSLNMYFYCKNRISVERLKYKGAYFCCLNAT